MSCGHLPTGEARLGTFGPEALPNPNIWPALRSWWLVHRGKTPTWDIAATCEIEGTLGLILVEAKANVFELNAAGKDFDAAAPAESIANHERIGLAIQEACTALRQMSAATAISRDSHYQLSNRVAFAWKLASLSVPTVLVYLSFYGDTGIAEARVPFKDENHWQRCFNCPEKFV